MTKHQRGYGDVDSYSDKYKWRKVHLYKFKPTGGELLMISRMQNMASEDADSIEKNVTFFNKEEVLFY